MFWREEAPDVGIAGGIDVDRKRRKRVGGRLVKRVVGDRFIGLTRCAFSERSCLLRRILDSFVHASSSSLGTEDCTAPMGLADLGVALFPPSPCPPMDWRISCRMFGARRAVGHWRVTSAGSAPPPPRRALLNPHSRRPQNQPGPDNDPSQMISDSRCGA